MGYAGHQYDETIRLVGLCLSPWVFPARNSTLRFVGMSSESASVSKDGSPLLLQREERDEIVVRMPKDVIAELAKLADQLNVDATTALRYAISTTAYLYHEREEGASLLLERGKKRYDVEWLTPRQFARQIAKD